MAKRLERFIMKKLLFSALCGIIFGAMALAPASKSQAEAALKGSTELSIVKVTFRNQPSSGGTGFVVQTPHGGKVIITNAHVCKGGLKDGVVVLSSKSLDHPVEARIMLSKPEEDLCVVEAPFFMPALQLGTAPVVGQHVNVIGHPWLRPLTLTEGYIRDIAFEVTFMEDLDNTKCDQVNQKKETVKSFFGDAIVCTSSFMSYEMVLTIYPGNSGSPLLDDSGKVVGVAFAVLPNSGSSNALKFDALKGIISVY